ncbi:MAG: leucine-rich repeat domain-containing protein [Lachnospiraceae bacterium]|nr:leucine-rich repeat domain-containing protein [Lachnospiraceae bacterium]
MKQRKKRTIAAWLMAIVMVFSIVMVPGGVAKAEAPTDTSQYVEILLRGARSIEISDNAATITYQNGKATVIGNDMASAVNDTWDYGDGNIGTMHILYTKNTNLTFTIIPDEGYTAYYYEDGQQKEVTENTYSLSDLKTKSEDENGCEVEFVFEDGNRGDPGNDGGDHNEDYEDITVNVTFTNTQGEVLINGYRTPEGPSYSGTLTKAGYTDSSKTNKIVINTSFGEYAVSKVTINETEYDFDPNGIDVPGASQYTITTTGDPGIPIPRTIIWVNPDYTPVDEEDAEWVSMFTIGHGYARAIAVYDESGKQLSANEYINDRSDEYGLEKGFGWLQTYPGYKVVFEFVPEYGYQLTGITINEQPMDASNIMNRFEFTMPNAGNIHFGATFTKTDDVVKSNTDKVSDGSISIGGGELDGGTARLSVSDVTLSAAQIGNFATAASGYDVASYLDIDLEQIFYKGKSDADDVWANDIEELNNDATITLTLADGVDGDEIVIVHEKHDGTYEIIPATYNATSNTITFKTSSFSNYAIASKSSGLTDAEKKAAADKTAADTVTNAINALPLSTSVTTTNQNAITSAKAAYDALTADQKALISADTLKKLTDAEKALTAAKKAEEDAKKAAEQPKATETGGTVTNTDSSSGSTTAAYTVSVKSSAAGQTGEVTYTGDSNTKATSVVIPDTIRGSDGVTYKVTRIADNALSGNKKVTKVTIGENVTEIGKNAFKNCAKLKTVSVKSSSITKIGESAFYGDKVLTTIDLSKSKVATIGKNAFSGCKKLKIIKMNGNNLKSVGKNAFRNIEKKAKITIYARNKSIYNKIVKKIENAGAGKAKAKFSFKKKK